MKSAGLLQEAKGKIKVFALTGIRSEYDLFYPVLQAMKDDPAFDLGVIVSGAHLTPLHQYSVKHIETDGFRIVGRIENLSLDNRPCGKAKAAGLLLQGLAELLEKETPHALLLLGDREEPLAGAIAGTYGGIPVIHIGGGDHTHPAGGNVDEEVRHAVTKLSHVHLTMTEKFSERILKLGEEPWRVKTVGNPGIDRLRQEPVLSRVALAAKVSAAAEKDYLILIHHPLSSSLGSAEREMEICFEACLESGLEVFVGAPNSDPGFEGVLKVIERHSKNPRVHMYRNLPRAEFANLLRNARCLVGNSSLGLLEAPYLGLPAVNVGERQRGRLSDGNVQFVDSDRAAVIGAIRKAAFDESYRSRLKPGTSLFGDGHMVEKSLEFIKSLPGRQQLLAKNITY